MKPWGVVAVALCGCLLTACGDDDDSTPGVVGVGGSSVGVGGAGAEAGTEDASAGVGTGGASDLEDAASAEVGPDGGTIVLDDVSVTVPAGALSEAATLTLRRVAVGVPGYETYSDVFELAVGGAEVAAPLHVSLAHRGTAALANLFETRPGSSGYFWVGTRSTDETVEGDIQGAGQFFAANGTRYEERTEEKCTRVDVVEGSFTQARAVNLLVRATDCAGHALPALKGGDFIALEDGEDLSAGVVALREPAPWVPFITFLVDAAVLAEAPEEASAALDAAIASVGELGARVAVAIYGNGGVDMEAIASTADLTAAHETVLGLSRLKLPGHDSSASFKATAEAAEAQSALRGRYRERNGLGALSAGFVIRVAASTSKESKTVRSKETGRLATSGSRVIAVPFGGDLDGPVNDQAFSAPDASGLRRALLGASQRVAALAGATYWLSYCSEKSSGVHQSGARTATDVFQLGAPGVFDATGSLLGCNPGAPLQDCTQKECGAPGCGACDDTTSQCDLRSGRCVSFCETERWCGGETHQNRNGYDQACDDTPTATACGGACVNLETDSANCGACGEKCPTGAACYTGKCECSGNLTLCDDACIDTALDSKNCGDCGHACSAGQGCFGGKCSGECPTSLHGPSLVKVPTTGGGIMCIDATEVTVGQYAEFVKDRAGDASGQIAECDWNLYFDPPEGCTRDVYIRPEPEKHPQECVDWCDAAAFCDWAGKRLCGGIDGRQVAAEDLADANKDAWYNACSSGGVNNYPFGNTCQSVPCILGGLWSNQVPAGYECQPSGAYTGVWDLVGNVAEWEDSCSGFPGFDHAADGCQLRGSSYGGVGVAGGCAALDQVGTAKCSFVGEYTRPRRDVASPRIGFRCCGR